MENVTIINHKQSMQERTDKPRRAERYRVRVKFNGIGANQAILAGNLVRDDGNAIEFVCYRDELNGLLQNVETEAPIIEQARRKWLRDLKAFVAKTADIPETALSDDFATWKQEYKDLDKRTVLSVERAFRELTGHDIRPLESVEVLEELGMPQSDAEAQAAALGAAMFERMPGFNQNTELAEMRKLIEAQQAQIEKLLASKK